MVSYPPPWARHNGYFLANIFLWMYKKKLSFFFFPPKLQHFVFKRIQCFLFIAEAILLNASRQEKLEKGWPERQEEMHFPPISQK